MAFKKIKYIILICFLLIKRLSTKIKTLILRITLNKDPAMIWILLNPKKGFNNFPIIKIIQQEIDDWKDDKTLKPKMLFCGSFIL